MLGGGIGDLGGGIRDLGVGSVILVVGSGIKALDLETLGIKFLSDVFQGSGCVCVIFCEIRDQNL